MADVPKAVQERNVSLACRGGWQVSGGVPGSPGRLCLPGWLLTCGVLTSHLGHKILGKLLTCKPRPGQRRLSCQVVSRDAAMQRRRTARVPPLRLPKPREDVSDRPWHSRLLYPDSHDTARPTVTINRLDVAHRKANLFSIPCHLQLTRTPRKFPSRTTFSYIYGPQISDIVHSTPNVLS